MPLLTTVIDDKSPLIVYDNTWLPGTSWDDQWAMDYYLGTFTTNNVSGSVSFDFNGTEIFVYGAHRPNHGTYTAQLDSSSFADLSSGGNNAFQQSLFNDSVSQGSHTLKLTNTGTNNQYLDIDLIVWQSEVGNTGDQLVQELVQDTDSRFQYQAGWSTSSPLNTNFNFFYNGTGHSTSTYSASVTFTFTVSDVVSLYGTTGPDNGQYSAQLDGNQAITYNASNVYPTNYAVMLYHADNLGSGSHQLVLTNLPAVPDQSLSIDYAELWITSNGTSTSTSPGTTSDPQNLSSNSSNLSSGAIAGIAVTAAVAILCALAAILFYRRWKAALATQQNFYRLDTPQPRSAEVVTVAPTLTGVSSSIETRGTGGLYRSDASGSTFGATRQPANNYTMQYYEAVSLSSNSRNSGGLIDTVSPPTSLSVEEALGRRPLPGAPGGGMPLSAEFPKLAVNTNVRSEPSSPTTVGRTSPAMTEPPPPNYSQAIGGIASHSRE